MKPRFFIVFLLIVLAFASPAQGMTDKQVKTEAEAKRYIRRNFKKYGKIKFIRFNNLTDKVLCHRKNKGVVIVDITEGICLNSNGDGRVINTRKGYGNYISYRGLRNCKKGSKVITYSVYEPWNNYTDGIMFRVDIVKPSRK